MRYNRLSGVIVPLAPEYNMGGFLRRNELNAFVSQSAHVNPLEQSLSPAQQDRRDSDVQLIDEASAKILLDSVRSAANAHNPPHAAYSPTDSKRGARMHPR